MFAVFYSNFEFSTGSVLTLKGYLVNQMVNMKGVARFILIWKPWGANSVSFCILYFHMWINNEDNSKWNNDYDILNQ